MQRAVYIYTLLVMFCAIQITEKAKMKIRFTFLMVIYILSICFFLFYAATVVCWCTAYWMHDTAIEVSQRKILIDTSCLFLLPFILLLVKKKYHLKTPASFYLTQVVLALLCNSLLVFVINKPGNNTSGVYFSFISLKVAAAYYLLKLTSYILVGVILYRTAFISHYE